jgi:hypothetical protein
MTEPEVKVFDSLDTVTKGALMDINEDMSRYEQFLYWAQEGYRDLKFDVAREVKTISADLTPYMAIKFPDDYIDWVKIGVNQDGAMMTFTHDPRIINHEKNVDPMQAPIPFSEGEGDIQFSSLQITDASFYSTNYVSQYGEDLGRRFGEKVKHNGLGYFRVNRARKEIQLNTVFISNTDQVYLEYIADCEDVTKETFVNPYLARVLKLYIHWQRKENNDRLSGSEKARAEDQYWREFNRVKARMYSWNLEDIMDYSRDGTYPVKY